MLYESSYCYFKVYVGTRNKVSNLELEPGTVFISALPFISRMHQQLNI